MKGDVRLIADDAGVLSLLRVIAAGDNMRTLGDLMRYEPFRILFGGGKVSIASEWRG